MQARHRHVEQEVAQAKAATVIGAMRRGSVTRRSLRSGVRTSTLRRAQTQVIKPSDDAEADGGAEQPPAVGAAEDLAAEAALAHRTSSANLIAAKFGGGKAKFSRHKTMGSLKVEAKPKLECAAVAAAAAEAPAALLAPRGASPGADAPTAAPAGAPAAAPAAAMPAD